jgi:hypothetical protein
MPDFKLVYLVAEQEINRDITAARDNEAIADKHKIFNGDPRKPDIGTLFVRGTGDDYRPLCSLCPKSWNRRIQQSRSRSIGLHGRRCCAERSMAGAGKIQES